MRGAPREAYNAEGEPGLKFELHPVERSIWLLVVFGVFAVACEATYLAEAVRPAVLSDLALTRANWWGIGTSMLVHLSPWHIANDAGSILLLSLLMFALANWRKDREPPVLAMCAIPFVSAVAATLVFYLLSPDPMAAGSSGVGYGMLGVVLGYSMDGTLVGLGELDWHGADLASNLKAKLKPMALYLGVFATMAAQVFISPAAFLNAAPGVNYGIHGLSFIFGLMSMYSYGFTRRHRSGGGGRAFRGCVQSRDMKVS